MGLECEVRLLVQCDRPGCGARSRELMIQGAIQGDCLPVLSADTFLDDGWGRLGDRWYCPAHLREAWARKRADHPLGELF